MMHAQKYLKKLMHSFLKCFVKQTLQRRVDAPSLVLSAAIETMDFSMPSYSKTLEGDTTGVKQAPGIPSFNPSFTFGIKEDKEETAAPAADTSAADEKVSKADERAAAEAKKAEEKAAAEAKKAEEKAAAEAKKAEKEARRLAEIEKQKEAVERAKQKDADKATAAPAKVDLQEMPDVSSCEFWNYFVAYVPYMSFYIFF